MTAKLRNASAISELTINNNQGHLTRKQIEKMMYEKAQIAKKKKINVESLDKLTEISKLDKYLFA